MRNSESEEKAPGSQRGNPGGYSISSIFAMQYFLGSVLIWWRDSSACRSSPRSNDAEEPSGNVQRGGCDDKDEGIRGRAYRTIAADRTHSTGNRSNGGSFHVPGQAGVRRAQPQCARRTLPVRGSHRKLEFRSKSQDGRRTVAPFQGNVARPLHTRRLCDFGRIPDDRSVRKVDRARVESARV